MIIKRSNFLKLLISSVWTSENQTIANMAAYCVLWLLWKNSFTRLMMGMINDLIILSWPQDMNSLWFSVTFKYIFTFMLQWKIKYAHIYIQISWHIHWNDKSNDGINIMSLQKKCIYVI